MTLAAAVAIAVLSQVPERDARPRVWLEVDACLPVSQEEVRRILAIELHAALETDPEPSADATRVRVGCSGDVTTLHVEDPITGKAVDRSIELPMLRKARPRLVALAVTELVAASWSEAEANPEPKVEPKGRTASPEARREVREAVQTRAVADERRDLRLAALVGARGSDSGPLYGGGPAVRYEAYGWGGVDLDAMALFGTSSTTLGRVSESNISAGLSLHALLARPRYVARVGLGLRGGPVWFVGQPYQLTKAAGSTLLGIWAGPMLGVSLDVPLTRAFALESSVEGGYVLRAVQANAQGAPVASVDGAWGAVNVGVSWGI